jgi:hypothetical protein
VTLKLIKAGLPILIALGLGFVGTVNLAPPAQAGCVGSQCCGYGQVWNYRDRDCEAPGMDSGR